jgi:hypothetical protein
MRRSDHERPFKLWPPQSEAACSEEQHRLAIARGTEALEAKKPQELRRMAQLEASSNGIYRPTKAKPADSWNMTQKT